MGELNDNLVDTANGITIDVLSNEDSLENVELTYVVGALYNVLLDETNSINPINLVSKINCYPNPAKDILYISNQNKVLKMVSLFDLSGKKIMEQTISPNNNRIELMVKNISPGIYVLKAQGKQSVAE